MKEHFGEINVKDATHYKRKKSEASIYQWNWYSLKNPS